MYINNLSTNQVSMEINDLTAKQLENAAEMLKAIAHPLRIAILNYLDGGGKKTVTEIHESLDIKQSVASHHLSILKNKDVLQSSRDGKNIYYYIGHDKLSTLIECISNCACS